MLALLGYTVMLLSRSVDAATATAAGLDTGVVEEAPTPLYVPLRLAVRRILAEIVVNAAVDVSMTDSCLECLVNVGGCPIIGRSPSTYCINPSHPNSTRHAKSTIHQPQTQPPPSIPGDERGRLLRRRNKNGGPAQPSIPAAALNARPKVQWGYIATMKLPGNQVRVRVG